jgi:uncharacterized protein (DUF1800 family)
MAAEMAGESNGAPVVIRVIRFIEPAAPEKTYGDRRSYHHLFAFYSEHIHSPPAKMFEGMRRRALCVVEAPGAIACCLRTGHLLDGFTRLVGSMIKPGLPKKSCCGRLAVSLRYAPLVLVTAIFSSAVTAAELSPRELMLLDRLTWGVNASSAAHLQTVGVERWLQEQLHPASTGALPDAVRTQIEAMPDVHKLPFDIAVEFDQRARSANQVADPEQKKAAQQVYQQAMNDRAKQAAGRTILRALYASDQLRERMTWFWFNHFNVHQHKANIRILVGDYVDRTIRPYSLGNFHDLLVATLHHPAMLRYLDNADNAAGHLNENYAREIMELHTMGVGSGYTQSDVEALARILTGVGIDLKPEDPKLKPELQSQLVREGAFEFNPARHDYGDKAFLGHTIKGRGLPEVDEAIDILVHHPATATHLANQIATYFVSDNPPNALVQRMAQTFKTTDGDIAAVLFAMVHAPEFTASLKPGTKFKDPVQYVLSAVRLAYDDKVIMNTAPIQSWLNRLSEGLFNRETPDGYAMTSASWNGPGQMMVRFDRKANRFGVFGLVQTGHAECGRSAGVPPNSKLALL